MRLSNKQIFSVYYHSVFNYPLRREDLKRWEFGNKNLPKINSKTPVSEKDGYFFVRGKKPDIEKRKRNEAFSAKKVKLAQKTASVLEIIPSVKMVGITGSLAMNNAEDSSDIDLMVITARNTLWITRGIALVLLGFFGFSLRKAGDTGQKDKLCINIWLDEISLGWNLKNVYTAHEICQIVPVVNKDETYEKFLRKNSWALDFWPNGILKANPKNIRWGVGDELIAKVFSLFDYFAYLAQRTHMVKKITFEQITKTHAIFHPRNLSDYVTEKLSLIK